MASSWTVSSLDMASDRTCSLGWRSPGSREGSLLTLCTDALWDEGKVLERKEMMAHPLPHFSEPFGVSCKGPHL